MATNSIVFCVAIIVVGLAVGIVTTLFRGSIWNVRLPARSIDPLPEYERLERERELEAQLSQDTENKPE